MGLENKKPRARNFLRFSGMAFSMAITIALFAFGGVWLDERTGNDSSTWTIVGSLFGVALAMYQVIRQATKP